MKITNKTLSAALALTMAVGTCSLFPAHAEPMNWDMRPDWTPHDFDSAMDFINTYGETHADDGMICIVRHVPKNKHMTFSVEADSGADYELRTESYEFEMPTEAPDKSDYEAYSRYEKLKSYIDFNGYTDNSFVGYHYEVLMIDEKTEGKLDIRVNVLDKDKEFTEDGASCYTFDGIRETDILGWLPDSYPEYTQYIKDNGNLSLHDGKLVYCHDVNYSTGAKLNVEQTGSGELKCSYDSFTYDDMIMLVAGNTSHLVRVYEGGKEGDVDISFDANIPWAPEEGRQPVLSASVRVDSDMKLSEKSNAVPDFIPQDKASLLDFLNQHGKTWVQDGIIICTRQILANYEESYTYSYEGSAAKNIKDCIIYNDKIAVNDDVPDLKYEVTAYKIPENSDIVINYDYGRFDSINTYNSFSFSKDSSGYITQKDIYSWLPDCEDEFNAYYAKHGAFSIQDGYIMYCTNIPSSSGYSLFFHQNGTGEVIMDRDEYSALAEDTYRDGGTMHVVKLYKPVREGVIRLDLFQARIDLDVLPEEGVDTACFRIDKDMNITPAEESELKTTVKGDCNCDGVVGLSDAVALQNWLLGKGSVSENGAPDINGDGVVDVFDLIALKKKVINALSEPPKPVFMNLSQNFAWSPYQYVNVYDQYGTQYTYAFHSANSEGYEQVKDSLVRLYEDNWYEQIQNIMDTAVEETTDDVKDKSYYCIKNNFAVPDRVIADITAFAKNTEKYSNKEMFTVPVGYDMGGTTSYIIGETGKGKPVYAALCCVGDSAGYIKEQEVKDFVKMLVNNNMASKMVFEMTEKEGMTY